VKFHRGTFQTWIESLACHAGVDPREAVVLAEVVVWSDMIGRPEQGVWRLPTYLKRFKLGLIRSPCHARILARKKAVSIVDGRNGFGQVIGRLAMRRAIRLASDFGVGVVGVKRSNHFGPAAYYVNLAAEKGYVGLAFSNSTPRVAPAVSKTPLLGTNPIALGAPRRSGRAILVDLSTSASAGSKIRRAAETGDAITSGIARDAAGQAVSDARAAVSGVLEPMGGSRGFALSILVEILSGVITGAAISREVASIYENFSQPNAVGHTFVVLDIEAFMSRKVYFDRIETLVGFMQSAAHASDSNESIVPGDRRWLAYDRHTAEGLYIDDRTCDGLRSAARELGVNTPW